MRLTWGWAFLMLMGCSSAGPTPGPEDAAGSDASQGDVVTMDTARADTGQPTDSAPPGDVDGAVAMDTPVPMHSPLVSDVEDASAPIDMGPPLTDVPLADAVDASSPDVATDVGVDAGADVVSLDVGGCATGTMLCGASCTNMQTDPANCGACGTVCTAANATIACTHGTCGYTCSPGFGDCDGIASNGCESALNTSAHCGACPTSCGTGMHCSGGSCMSACPSGEALCAATGTCAALASDTANCGSCGNVCATPPNASPTCILGSCGMLCHSGFAHCAGPATLGCESNLASSPTACGACGNTCPGSADATATCTSGACGLTCASGFGNCDGSLVNGCEANLTSSVSNCGTCGTSCPSVPNATATCTSGACAFACQLGYGNCDGLVSNGCETTLATNLTSCGTCGSTCPTVANATSTCTGGACGFTCAAGFSDCDGIASNGCEAALNTSAHCGSCAASCGSGTHCSSGSCMSVCPSGTTLCAASGTCATTSTDVSNCGSCGNVCATPANATAICTGATCGFLCLSGFGDCDGIASNGCEASLATSITACGACGNTCPARANATTTCTSGTCGFTCSTGYGNCDGILTNGCETATSSSPSNCGACGTVCALSNVATDGCSAGACTVVACAAGHADCDGIASDCCESTSATDASNCGACGHACGVGQTCSGGACACATSGTTTCGTACCTTSVQVCSSAATSTCTTCGGSTPNVCGGACTNVQTDASNCGTCGHACTSGATCSGGVCCGSGLTNCSGTCMNTASDVNNCGSCGHACTSGMVCSSGTCGSVTLSAPRQIAPLSTATVTSQNPTLHWVLASGATGAYVQVCHDRPCTTVEQTFSATGTSGSVPTTMTPGVHFWRIASTVSGSVASGYSTVWEFFVRHSSAPVDTSSSSVVDLNGDGYADYVVGAGAMGPTYPTAAFVYPGGAGGATSTPTPLTGPLNPGFGSEITSAGDINGDGFGDLLIGAPGLGMTYVYFGSPSGVSTTPTVLTGPSGSDFGGSVTGLGDANGDGYADVAVAAYEVSPEGVVYIYLGGASGVSPTPAILRPPSGATLFGRSIAGAGDVNGDGLGDLFVSASTSGSAYLSEGILGGVFTAPSTTLPHIGSSVSSAGDVNGDGYADVLVANPAINAVYCYPGGVGGLGTPTTVTGASGVDFGSAAYTGGGDINGDGYDDLLVGAPGGNEVYVYLGGTGGVTTVLPLLTGPIGSIFFGLSAASPGDVNGDGYTDIIVGASGSGGAYTYLGTPSGPAATPTALAPPTGADDFGDAVASAILQCPSSSVPMRTVFGDAKSFIGPTAMATTRAAHRP